jgi:hypothetical protein
LLPALIEYGRLSRTPWYSLVFILPLVVLYELLAVMVNWGSVVEWRNAADVVLRQLLEIFGLGAPYILGALAALGLLGAWLWQRRTYDSATVSGAILVGMLLESCLWAALLLVALTATDRFLMLSTADNVLKTAFLAVGAGIYEEGLFRLIMISGLLYFFRRVLAWHSVPAMVIAVAGAAVLFALFHYIGPAAEPFDWNSFGYRSVAGVFLGALYLGRGFGITVYAHTIYDLLVLGIRTLGL